MSSSMPVIGRGRATAGTFEIGKGCVGSGRVHGKAELVESAQITRGGHGRGALVRVEDEESISVPISVIPEGSCQREGREDSIGGV